MKTTQAIDRLRQVIRRQHKALATEDNYVFWLGRYIKALRGLPPELPSEKKLESFLTGLALRHNVAASSQNQAFNAVLFFYKEVLGQPLGNVDALRAKRPVHERHAPSVGDTCLLLRTIRNVGGYPTNLIARMLYGCGLRVSEPLNLRIKDINLERGTLCIRGAKGGHDRVVHLPRSLVAELKEQMRSARLVWQFDRQNRTPLMLPHRLARKYPASRKATGSDLHLLLLRAVSGGHLAVSHLCPDRTQEGSLQQTRPRSPVTPLPHPLLQQEVAPGPIQG
jgi:integrase